MWKIIKNVFNGKKKQRYSDVVMLIEVNKKEDCSSGPAILNLRIKQIPKNMGADLAKFPNEDLNARAKNAELTLKSVEARLQIDNTDDSGHPIQMDEKKDYNLMNLDKKIIEKIQCEIELIETKNNQIYESICQFDSELMRTLQYRLNAKSKLDKNRCQDKSEEVNLVLEKNTSSIEKIKSRSRSENELLNERVPEQYSISTVHEYYINFGNDFASRQTSCIVIDAKSLPRSGMHYLKKSLTRIYGENFSFCEWYQEPGCCKQMPCALTGYIRQCKSKGAVHVRLLKSHDFDLSDPVYRTNKYLQRLILIRDPLYILTSLFTLEQLASYKSALAKEGINMEKIWYLHEKVILDSAYEVLDANYIPPSSVNVAEWLEIKSKYIDAFMRKWIVNTSKGAMENVKVVKYEDIDKYIEFLTSRIHLAKSVIHDSCKAEIESRTTERFQARADPFQTNSIKITDYLRENSALFVEKSDALKKSAGYAAVDKIVFGY